MNVKKAAIRIDTCIGKWQLKIESEERYIEEIFLSITSNIAV